MLSFLAPFFLAGAALIGLPWLIHHIRKPEREPIIFSSLMFLPNVKKEVIERRKLQHILLMLLRMLLLVLMALAFSRPYFKERRSYVQESAAPGRHLILLDLSYSMGMSNRFEQAGRTVRDILGEIPADIPVGLVGFSDSPVLLAPMEGVPSQTRARVKSELEKAVPGQGGTRYQAALQYAENLLLEGRDAEETTPAVLHLISDFSRGGMPEGNPDWRLSGRILFRGYRIDGRPIRNLSLMEIGRKDREDRLEIAGKVKNWSETEESAVVRLLLGEELLEEKEVTVAPGGASQVRFDIPRPAGNAREGRLMLVGDDFELDNLRYFVWRAPRKKTILLLTDKDKRRWPADWFVERVLTAGNQVPWRVIRVDRNNLAASLARRPDVVAAVGLKTLEATHAAALSRYVEGGGRVLMSLGDGPSPNVLSRDLLAGLGLNDLGPAFPETNPANNQLLGWIDFDHPTFLVFRGARFNDFSGLRFYNYHRIQATAETDEDISFLARFDGREDPAMVEVRRGEGRWLIWAFNPVLDWTNLPKHPKFVPLLHETVKYLGRFRQEEREYLVGGRYDAREAEGSQRLRLPDGRVHEVAADASIPLERAGIVLAGAQDRADEWQALDAVNIPGGESDPETIQIDEFALRLTANGGVAQGAAHGEVERYSGDVEKRNEMGFIFVILLALFVATEIFYAARLSIRKPADAPNTPQPADRRSNDS
ncbi:MAG: BatA and WFA domain-containing protein [Acidobacteriota bacterium]|nr:BatA and WFA domain-containing protein [Acidobacteriota bacterium]